MPRPRAHGDLFRCRDCGAVQQPALPAGEELHALYREMRDDAYLTEEAGRRATAAPAARLIAEHVPARAAARRRLRPRAAARRGARRAATTSSGSSSPREAAGTPATGSASTCARSPLEDFDAGARGFDVIVLADVHRAPGRPGRRASTPARDCSPGGVLCVITPDPSSPTARLAGRALVGLRARPHLPAARAARCASCSAARGLVDLRRTSPLVRSFAAALLGRRARGARRPRCGRRQRRSPRRARRAGVARCRSATSASCSRTQVAVRSRPSRSSTDRGGERPRARRAARLQRGGARSRRSRPRCRSAAADRALLVDDASPDDDARGGAARGLRACCATRPTAATAATRRPATCARCSTAPTSSSWSTPTTSTTRRWCERWCGRSSTGNADVVIGSRLLEDETIAGGMPRWKWVGNRFLTAIENLAFRRGFSEYHTGYRAFSADFLRSIAVPAQLRRLRLRPGDLRPDRRARRARGRDRRSRRATSSRRRASRSDERAVRPATRSACSPASGGRHGRSWTLLRRPAVDWPEPPIRSARPAA